MTFAWHGDEPDLKVRYWPGIQCVVKRPPPMQAVAVKEAAESWRELEKLFGFRVLTTGNVVIFRHQGRFVFGRKKKLGRILRHRKGKVSAVVVSSKEVQLPADCAA